MNRDLRTLQERLGLSFADPQLLRQAFVHRSYVNEKNRPGLESNERLEFLGDAVVGFVVADHLYHTYPELSEGQLTTLRAALVRRETLAQAARRLKLGSCLVLGKGVAATGARQRPVLLAAAFEALAAAVAIDRGIEAAHRFVVAALEPELSKITVADAAKDAKSRLQERVQARWHVTPDYRTVAAEGPDHAKRFAVEVMVASEVIGQGAAETKRQAQQAAAESGLRRLADGWQPSVLPTPEGNTRGIVDARTE